MRRLLSSIGFIVALLCPWTAFAQNPPASCTTTSQNLWVRDQLNTYYYWYQNLTPGVNPASFSSPEAYLEAVRYRPIDNYSSSFRSGRAVEQKKRASREAIASFRSTEPPSPLTSRTARSARRSGPMLSA